MLRSALVSSFTARSMIQTQLVEAHNRILESRAAELEAFAARVVHDLKQPLGAVAMRAESARQKPERAAFGKMIEQLKRMDQTIDDLLEFARSGAKPQTGQRSSVMEVIQDVISDLKPVAGEIGAEMRVELPAPIYVACPVGALSSILSNLVRNAVKYIVNGKQPNRRIIVRGIERGKVARITVDDTGPGLPPGVEQVIFQPYVRLPGNNQPGIGLGLATVKRMVEAYGGTVGLESVLGRGSSFWFELPLAGSDARVSSNAR